MSAYKHFGLLMAHSFLILSPNKAPAQRFTFGGVNDRENNSHGFIRLHQKPADNFINQ